MFVALSVDLTGASSTPGIQIGPTDESSKTPAPGQANPASTAAPNNSGPQATTAEAPFAQPTRFVGRVQEVDLETGLIIVRGQPMDVVAPGQVYEVVLDQEVYAKIRVQYVEADSGDDSYFEATAIEGRPEDIYRVLAGQGLTLEAGYESFLVLDPLEKQYIACKMKDFSVRRFTVVGQTKNGFIVEDPEKPGATRELPFFAFSQFFYKEEAPYKKLEEAEAAANPELPGYLKRQREAKEEARQEQEYKFYILQAERNLVGGALEEADQNAREAAKIFPKRYKPDYIRGQVDYRRSNYAAAQNKLLSALKKEGAAENTASIQLILAYCYYYQKDNRGAEYYLKRALAGGKGNFDTNFLFAQISLDLGKFNRSLDYYLKALTDPAADSQRKARAHYHSAKIFFKNQGDTPQAWKHIQTAKKLDDGDEKIQELYRAIQLALMKEAQMEVAEEEIGGIWKSADNRLYVRFFEESVFVLFYDRRDGKTRVIMVGGDMQKEGKKTIILTAARQQRLTTQSDISITKGKIEALYDHMFSGSDEFEEVADIVFRVKEFSRGRVLLVVDGKEWRMTPLQ